MKSFHLLPLLTFYGVTQAVAEVPYYISDTTTASTGGVPSSCILAVPPIQYREDGNFIAINESQIEDPRGVLKQGHALRIGYVEEYATFLYKGCVLPSDLQSVSHTNIQKEPGQCYLKCGTNVVGLQGTICHCIEKLNTVINFFRNGCTSRCSITSGIVCGSKSEISIYQKVNDEKYSRPRNQGGDCLAFEPFTRRSLWSRCSAPYQEMCQRDSQIDIRQKYHIWSKVMQNCLADSEYPVNEFLLHTISKQGSGLWTGMIRSPTISCRRADYTNKKEMYQRGLVEFSNNEFQLFFNRTYAEYNLCEREVTTLPMTDTLMTTPANPVSQKYQPNGSSQSASTLGTPEDSDGPSRVVLYITIPAALIVIGGVIACIIWKRRHKSASQTTNSTAPISEVNTTHEYENSFRHGDLNRDNDIRMETAREYEISSRYEDLIRNNDIRLETGHEYASLEHVYENVGNKT